LVSCRLYVVGCKSFGKRPMEDGRPLRYDEGRQNGKPTDEGRSLLFSFHPSSIFPRPSSLVHHPSPFIHLPSSFIHLPSSLVHHPSSLVHRPSSLVLHPSSLFPRPSSIFPRPSSLVLLPSDLLIFSPSFFPHSQFRLPLLLNFYLFTVSASILPPFSLEL